MNFSNIWNRIVQHAGEDFYTVTNIRFTYQISCNSVITDRTTYPLAQSQFEKAYNLGELKNPSQINKLVRGPSYVYAILTDARIK